MIEPIAHPEGVVLALRVQPKARRTRVVGEHGGALKVAIAQPPEQGKANRALLELLCEVLSLEKAGVRLISGETSREKRVLLIGLTPIELRKRLGRLGVTDEA